MLTIASEQCPLHLSEGLSLSCLTPKGPSSFLGNPGPALAAPSLEPSFLLCHGSLPYSFWVSALVSGVKGPGLGSPCPCLTCPNDACLPPEFFVYTTVLRIPERDCLSSKLHTLGNLFNLSVPRLSHLKNGYSTDPTVLLGGENELVFCTGMRTG